LTIFRDLGESRIFKDESVLSTEYLPPMLPHREDQIQQLARNLLPASKGRRPQNTFIHGGPGIGKTATAKYVFREFEEYSERVKCVYLNCWDFRTAVAVFSELATSLGMLVQRHGWGKDEIMARFVEAAKKSRKSLIVCLDEVDQLEQEALYDLLRINQYVPGPVGLVFVSNIRHVFASMEPRIRSSLAVEELEFKPYSILEMRDILAERAKYAFHSIDPAAVMLCANHAVQNGGDVRVGLECLLKAGHAAEDEGVIGGRDSGRVSAEHVKGILRAVHAAKPEILKERISDTERAIVKILADGKAWKSGLLYKAYKKLSEKEGRRTVTDRAFRDCVNHLAEIGLVTIAPKRIGSDRIIQCTKNPNV
jgi:cell division control protein 6